RRGWTAGGGPDAAPQWFDRDLRLSVDVFDASFDQYPRVKITAAYEVFRHVYVLGGVDELLNTPQNLQIVKGTSDVPIHFDTFRHRRHLLLPPIPPLHHHH